MKITEILTTEHAVFCAMFDQIERALSTLKSSAEVKALAGLLETLLRGHGETEQDLAYGPLDHLLKEKKQLSRLFSDHREMDSRMKEVQATGDPAQARRLLEAAMVMSREHFRYEEQTLFPLVEKVLKHDSLEKLGDAYMQKRKNLPR
jgi:hemerythrin-like domain-containing protein